MLYLKLFLNLFIVNQLKQKKMENLQVENTKLNELRSLFNEFGVDSVVVKEGDFWTTLLVSDVEMATNLLRDL